jgi:enoyl-CoA hydratase
MIERETIGDVEIVRLAHGKVNALDLELLTELTTTLRALAEDGPPLVLTGRGSSFSAGVDLRRIVDEPVSYVETYLRALTTAFCTLYGYPGPAVAALNGHAIAGGYVLAAACDHRIIADGTGRVGLTELAVGVPFPTSGIEIVRNAVGTRTTRTLALGADLMEPAAALAGGLVDAVVEPDALLDDAVAWATTRADRGRDAYRLTKRQLQRPAWEHIERAGPGEDAQVRAMWTHPDSLARIRSFLSSR